MSLNWTSGWPHAVIKVPCPSGCCHFYTAVSLLWVMSVVWISHACPTVPFKFQIINMCNNRDAFKEGLKMPHPKIVFMHSRMTVCQSVLSVRTPSPTHTHTSSYSNNDCTRVPWPSVLAYLLETVPKWVFKNWKEVQAYCRGWFLVSLLCTQRHNSPLVLCSHDLDIHLFQWYFCSFKQFYDIQTSNLTTLCLVYSLCSD